MDLHPDIKTVEEAAKCLGISKHSLYALIRADKLPAMHFGKLNHTIRLHWPTVIQAMHNQKEGAA